MRRRGFTLIELLMDLTQSKASETAPYVNHVGRWCGKRRNNDERNRGRPQEKKMDDHVVKC